MKKVTEAQVIYDSETDKYSFKLNNPLSVCWQINRKCNLNCKYCISSSGISETNGMSTESAIKVIKEIGRLNIGRLDFTGGEPLMRDDLEILLKEARRLKINTIVTTNTLLLTDEKIKMLRKYASIVQVSIDGTEKTHNSQRRAKVFKKTLENIQKLMASGCKVRLNSFIYKDNLKDIDFLLNLSKKLKVYSHLFILFAAQGRGVNHEDQIISKKRIEKLKRKLETYGQKENFYIRVYDYEEYAHSCVLITPKGDVISQALLEKDCIRTGNVLKTPLDKLFADKSFKHFTHLNHYLQRRNDAKS
jgi:MoaA/NifB/PqqE/SkfB family radical SAM enzyme